MKYYKVFWKLVKTTHIPRRTKKFNKRKHRKKIWITNDLLAKVVKNKEQYVKWKTIPLTSVNYELNKKSFKDCEKNVAKDIINVKNSIFTEFSILIGAT